LWIVGPILQQTIQMFVTRHGVSPPWGAHSARVLVWISTFAFHCVQPIYWKPDPDGARDAAFTFFDDAGQPDPHLPNIFRAAMPKEKWRPGKTE
jgi:hypothetical protein